jgi:hypothetical protein
MKRRDLLQVGGGILATAVLAGGAGATQTTAERLEPLGSVDIPGATDCTVQGEFAYVAADDGFAVVDISEPAAPEIVAERRDIDTGAGQQVADLLDCWVWEDRFVIGGPGNPNANSANGFALYDVSDPTAPEQLAFYETGQSSSGGYFIHNLFVDDGIVYLTGSGAPTNPLVMVDITGAQPQEVGRWSLEDADPGYATVSAGSRSLHDVTVQNGIAYIPCWDAGTWIVDVSDPTAPTTFAQISEYSLSDLQELSPQQAFRESFVPPGNAHYTMVSEDGTLLAVGKESWAFEGNGGPGGIDLYDVSTKTDPEYLSRIDAPPGDDQTRGGAFTSAHNFDFVGDRLYSSWYYGGVRVHDISAPSKPEELGHWQDATEASFWTADGTDNGFVATSADVSKILGTDPPTVREALYVFPEPSDVAGNGQEEQTEQDQSGETDQADGASDADKMSETNKTSETNDTANADGAGPGFGVPAAIGGVLGGYYWRLRGDDSGREEDRV